MYIKILYNIKNNAKYPGRRGEGQYLNPKHSQAILKKKKNGRKKN